MDTLNVKWLGRVAYDDGLGLQKTAVQQRNENPNLPDQLYLLEHPHTYTLGVRGNRDNLLVQEQQLARLGVSIHHVRRGGDITYHGPGQLVGYPIFNVKRANLRLGNRPLSVRAYIETIESALILALTGFGIESWQEEKYPGVWVEKNGSQAKIAAIGVHINHSRISSHGFALNVNPDMTFFDKIIPCGIQEFQVTSMAEVLKRPLTIEEVLSQVEKAFLTSFEIQSAENMLI